MEIKDLSNQELRDIYWLIFKAKKITGKNKEKEIIKTYVLLDKLLKLDKHNKKEVKAIENMILRDMRRKLEEGG